MEGVKKGQSNSPPMLTSSSRLSPLAKPFSLKKGHDQDHDHRQHVRLDASNLLEGVWMSNSGFSCLPLIPSLDLDNYLKEEKKENDNSGRSQSCEKGSVPTTLIGSQPYSSVVSRILDEYGPDRVVKESNLFDCAQKIISSSSNGGLHAPDSNNGCGLQEDDSRIGLPNGFPFKRKDPTNSSVLHVDMKKGNRTSKESKLLDETCNNVNTDAQMKFWSAEHEQEDAKLRTRASDVVFPFQELVALDWKYPAMTKGTSFYTYGGQAPALSTDHDCQSSVSCQSWVNQLVSSPVKHVVSSPQNIGHLQTQAYLQSRSDMHSSIVGVDTSKPPVMDSLPAVECNPQLIEACIVHVDAEKAADGTESFGNLVSQPERIKLGHNEIEKDDPDVDSPCWKGLSCRQVYSRTLGASDAQNPATKLVTKNSLNPSAPQFFPQNAKSWSSYEDGKLVPEDLFSFLRTSCAPPTEALPEMLDFEEDFCTPVEYGPLWPPAHSDMSDHGNIPLQKGDEKFEFCLDQPFPEENYFRDTDGAEMLTGPAVKKATGVPLLGASNASGTAPLQKNSVSVLSEPTLIDNTHYGASASINMSLNIDEKVLVDTMHDLSKLLLTKCRREHSFDKLNHERIRAVIGNLLICMEGGHAKRDSMHEPANLCISDNPSKYTDALTKNDLTTLRKGSHEVCGSGGAVIRTHQSLEKTPSAICFDEAKISQQAQLYRTLWHEAQAELHSLKSKASTSRVNS